LIPFDLPLRNLHVNLHLIPHGNAGAPYEEEKKEEDHRHL
jgi:hypothetical protein